MSTAVRPLCQFERLGSCLVLEALGHLDLQVFVFIQVAGSIPSLLVAKAGTAYLPKEGGVLLLSAEPVGHG